MSYMRVVVAAETADEGLRGGDTSTSGRGAVPESGTPAHLDVEQFLSQAQLMLDVHETNVESILDAMLHHLLDNDEQSGPAAFHDAKKVLFTHDSGAHTNIHCDPYRGVAMGGAEQGATLPQSSIECNFYEKTGFVGT